MKLTEVRGVTPGLMRALQAQPSRVACASCRFPLPVYPGRYPKSCPQCGEPAVRKSEFREDGHRSASA